jgi:hypothetical protein
MNAAAAKKVAVMKVAKKPAAADGQLDTGEANMQQLRAQWREERDFNKAKGYKWTPSFARWLKRGGKILTQ